VVRDQWLGRVNRSLVGCIAALEMFSPKTVAPDTAAHFAELDSRTMELLLAQLVRMGALSEVSDTSGNLRVRAGILDKYRIWWDEALGYFAERGWIRSDGGRVAIANAASPGEPESIWREWETFRKRIGHNNDIRPLAELISDCFRELAAILRGNKLMTDILFPEGSLRRMELLYKDNQVARFFNTALAETAVDYFETRLKADPLTKIRILEIGAGTGGTTTTLL